MKSTTTNGKSLLSNIRSRHMTFERASGGGCCLVIAGVSSGWFNGRSQAIRQAARMCGYGK